VEIRPELHLKQTLKLIMTPQLQQAIKMLQLSNIELTERIEDELIENPALEVEEKENEYANDLEEKIKEKRDLAEGKPTRYEEGFEDEFFFEDRSFFRADRGFGEDKKREFLEGAVSREETLREYLFWQLRLLKITPEETRIGEILINCIDSKGYLSVPLEEIVSEFSVPQEKLLEVLTYIQGLDPPGVGARDIKECLIIQLKNKGSFPLAERIVKEYLNELKMNKFEEIAKKLKVTISKLKEAFSVISKLEPYPGRQFYSDEIKYIIPEVIVEEKEGNFEVFPNSASIPRLKVNGYFQRLARKNITDKNIRDFAADKVQAARNFIHSVEQRESTLLRVSKTILEEQREFFEKGPKYLKPLTLKDVSGALGLHESTISRITSSKYVQTPFGVFPLKYFFSNSIPAQGNREYSATSIKEIVKDIIEEEGGKKHLSDQKIANILAKRGIKLARRTVAKYRKELHILPSNLRR
jgi:RNA polymerase sigma-54 factor